MKLADMCSLIRSKNAGPFTLTFDIMFDGAEKYAAAKQSGVLSKRLVAELYGCPEEEIQWFECDGISSIKFSMPRPVFQGELEDGDCHGGQQHAPLLIIEVPYPLGGESSPPPG